jgi:hypothetical protein
VNIKPNVHNAVMIIALAILGILALKWAARTQLANVPVVGQVFKLAATA